MPQSERDYKVWTGWVHLTLAFLSLLACLPALWSLTVPAWVGLCLSALTNALIGWAKFDTVQKN